MVENFTDFYDTFFEFSANIAYRIVKEKNISKDIAQEGLNEKVNSTF